MATIQPYSQAEMKFIDVLKKAIINNEMDCYPTFHCSSKVPTLVNLDNVKLGTIKIPRFNTNDILRALRVKSGGTTNNWIIVDDSIDDSNHLIDEYNVIVLDQIKVGNTKYEDVMLTNISNINNHKFPDKWFHHRKYNYQSRNKDYDKLVQLLDVPVYEGTTDIPHAGIEFDGVAINDFDQFISCNDFYSTLFHEIAHYYRKKYFHVYDRELDNEQYAREEVIAESASYKLCEALGITVDKQNSIKYIAGWEQSILDHCDNKDECDRVIEYNDCLSNQTFMIMLSKIMRI